MLREGLSQQFFEAELDGLVLGGDLTMGALALELGLLVGGEAIRL